MTLLETIAWVVLGLVAYFAVAIPLAIFIGRGIKAGRGDDA